VFGEQPAGLITLVVGATSAGATRAGATRAGARAGAGAAPHYSATASSAPHGQTSRVIQVDVGGDDGGRGWATSKTKGAGVGRGNQSGRPGGSSGWREVVAAAADFVTVKRSGEAAAAAAAAMAATAEDAVRGSEASGMDRGGSGRVRLTDPEGFMVSTELISTLVARLPSLKAL